MIDVRSSLGKCPPTYPFAYNYGEKCCKDTRDAAGNTLTIRSEECINESTSSESFVNCSTSGEPNSEFCKNAGM